MTKYLIDPHTFIWYINFDKTIYKKAITYIENENTVNYISIASFWEIAIKINLGKLDITISFDELFILTEKYAFVILPVSFAHTKILSSLSQIHKDPFDRMLVAQAINDNLEIITRDEIIATYPVKTI